MKKSVKFICTALIFSILVSLFSFGTLGVNYAPDAGAFVFDGELLLQYVTDTHNLNVIYDPYENALRTVVNSFSADTDSYFILDYSLLQNTLRAEDYAYLLITYRCPRTNSRYASTSEVFLSTGAVTRPTAGHSILFDPIQEGKYVVKIINLSDIAWWNGDIHNIRIDTFSKSRFGDTMYIDSVILCADNAQMREVRTDRLKNAGTPADGFISDYICNKYNVQKYTSPVWKGNIVYNEAVYPVKEKDGSAVYTLMYTPEKVQSVYDATFSRLYQEGIDYTVEENKLKILPGGSIPTMEYTYIHPVSNPNHYSWDRYYNRTAAGDGKWEYWGQSPEFFAGYLNVTYIHSDTWKGWTPENKADALPITSRKIQNNEKMNAVFFGDSITGGANSSSYRNVYPFAEYWNEQIIRKLEETYGCTNISAYYSSEGGSSASGMVSALGENVIQYAPDLVFIAFGMNDCMNESQDSNGSRERVQEQYKNAIDQMISQVRRQYPDCEFVLVPSFYGNIHCHFRSYYDACRDALLELEDTYSGVACADITSMQASLLEFKDYLDFSGDNMCHPNDFMARLYAQVCLETIVPGGVDAYVPAKDPEEKPDQEPVNPSALGDINGDGRITPADITLFRLYVAGKADAGQVVREACDLNGDGRITPADITVLRLYLAGRIILETGEIVDLLPPEYWIREIENKGDSIKERQESGTDAFQFVWFSDMHGVTGYANQNGAGTSSQINIGKTVQYLCDNFNIPLVATSGDIMSQASHTAVQNVYNEYKNIHTVLSPIPAERLLAVRGNHDGSWGEAVNGVYYLKHIGAGAVYNEIYRKQAQDGQRVFGGDGTYFYADSVPHKVRFIMLNSNTDGDGSNDASGNAVYNSQKVSVYGTEQLAWLGDVALHMPAGWTAVIMAHQPPDTSGDGALLAGMIEAYNSREAYSGTIQITHDYWGKNVSDNTYKTVTVDMDFTEAEGEIAAFFHGHIHKDTVDTQTYAFPCISITTAGGDVRDSSPAQRTPGTATETAIDVVTLDKAARKIYMTRVGVGMDRSCSY